MAQWPPGALYSTTDRDPALSLRLQATPLKPALLSTWHGTRFMSCRNPNRSSYGAYSLADEKTWLMCNSGTGGRSPIGSTLMQRYVNLDRYDLLNMLTPCRPLQNSVALYMLVGMIIQDIGEPPLLDLERQVLLSGMSWTGNLLGQFLQLVAEFAVPRHNLVPPDLAVHQAIG